MTRALLSLLLALPSTPAAADPVHIVGTAGITDGDTLRIDGTRIRLHGIYAPERDQQCQTADGHAYACGHVATKALKDFINGRTVDCRVVDVDRYQRSAAICLVEGSDIGGWLVTKGLAVAYRRYSVDYIDEEDRARTAKVGLWSGEFDNPWAWRKDH